MRRVTEVVYKVVSDDERHYVRAGGTWSNPEYDKLANLLKEDATLFIEGRSRGVLESALKKRGVPVRMSKRENGFVVWKKDNNG